MASLPSALPFLKEGKTFLMTLDKLEVSSESSALLAKCSHPSSWDWGCLQFDKPTSADPDKLTMEIIDHGS